jgi:hypothetical protein
MLIRIGSAHGTPYYFPLCWFTKPMMTGCTFGYRSQPSVQTNFVIKTSVTDFVSLADFDRPSGSGTNQLTVIAL